MFTVANLNCFTTQIIQSTYIPFFFNHVTRNMYYVLLFSSYYETIAVVALRVPG